MKKLEFETSKGRFVVFNAVTDDFDGFKYKTNYYFKGRIIKLSEITEEQANAIVDKVMNNQHFQNYDFKEVTDRWTKSAIESLHSLLKSKEVHLFENPLQSTKPTEDLSFYDNPNDVEIVLNQWQEAEQKTFYNPYIFKLCTK